MGLRKDLDRVADRYIYYLMNDNIVLYIGTSINPKGSYKNHLKKIKEGNTAKIYQFCINNNITPSLKIVSKITMTYNEAEKIETQHIEKHKDTCLNFFNNPNRILKPGDKKLHS